MISGILLLVWEIACTLMLIIIQSVGFDSVCCFQDSVPFFLCLFLSCVQSISVVSVVVALKSCLFVAKKKKKEAQARKGRVLWVAPIAPRRT